MATFRTLLDETIEHSKNTTDLLQVMTDLEILLLIKKNKNLNTRESNMIYNCGMELLEDRLSDETYEQAMNLIGA